jgi:predicted transglutaminase-like cysteine proteinase
MRKAIVLAAGLLTSAGMAQARDPLAPLDTPQSCLTCTASSDAPDAFGSVALRAGVTMYDARFRRVSSKDANAPAVLALAKPLKGLSHEDMLSRVQQIVRARVQFMSDPDSMKVADLWANAGETLATGYGDDEDIAIVKMQILKAAGYPADDLYLSVGRHPKRGAHIVLLARQEGGFRILDHLHAVPLSADRKSAEFTPVVTVGTHGSWIHGYRRTRSLAAR